MPLGAFTLLLRQRQALAAEPRGHRRQKTAVGTGASASKRSAGPPLTRPPPVSPQPETTRRQPVSPGHAQHVGRTEHEVGQASHAAARLARGKRALRRKLWTTVATAKAAKNKKTTAGWLWGRMSPSCEGRIRLLRLRDLPRGPRARSHPAAGKAEACAPWSPARAAPCCRGRASGSWGTSRATAPRCRAPGPASCGAASFPSLAPRPSPPAPRSGSRRQEKRQRPALYTQDPEAGARLRWRPEAPRSPHGHWRSKGKAQLGPGCPLTPVPALGSQLSSQAAFSLPPGTPAPPGSRFFPLQVTGSGPSKPVARSLDRMNVPKGARAEIWRRKGGGCAGRGRSRVIRVARGGRLLRVEACTGLGAAEPHHT